MIESSTTAAQPVGSGAPSRPRLLYAVTAPITATGFLRGQLAYLVAQGFDVHLACAEDGSVRTLAREEGVTFHHVPLTRTWWAWADARGLVAALRLLRRIRPDLLNYSTPKAALVWSLACLLGRRPRRVVYLLRGLRLDGERPGTVSFGLLWLCEVLSARVADTVVCVSGGVQRRATALRLLRPGTATVLGAGSSNGVDTSRFAPGSGRRVEVRRRLGFAPDEVVLGFVGRLTRDKGIYDLLDAIAMLPHPPRVLLVGPTEPDVDLGALWRRYAALRPLITHVEYTRETPDYYAAMDVFVLPSHREGMCNALLEAQAMGLPCVTTAVTGCLDAVVAGETALVVPPRTPVDLARAIAQLLEQPDLRARLGRAGRQFVTGHFDPEQVWARYALLYRQQLESVPATKRGGRRPTRPRRPRAADTA